MLRAGRGVAHDEMANLVVQAAAAAAARHFRPLLSSVALVSASALLLPPRRPEPQGIMGCGAVPAGGRVGEREKRAVTSQEVGRTEQEVEPVE